MDVYLLVFSDLGLAEIQTNTPTESIETGSVERLALEHILIATVANSTTDTLPVLVERNGTLQPLVVVVAVTADDEFYT